MDASINYNIQKPCYCGKTWEKENIWKTNWSANNYNSNNNDDNDEQQEIWANAHEMRKSL